MLTRRTLLTTALATGALALAPPLTARASVSIHTYRITGSLASVKLHSGAGAAILLHIARRWHYEITPLGTGEATVTGYSTDPKVPQALRRHYLAGTAIALGAAERLRPHQETVIRDILADCGDTVTWGGPPNPTHFHLTPNHSLTVIAARLDTTTHTRSRYQTPGAVADPGRPRPRRAVRPDACTTNGRDVLMGC